MTFAVYDNDGEISSDNVTVTVVETPEGDDKGGGSGCFLNTLGY